MAAKEAAAVDRPDRLTRPIIPTSLPPEVTDELPFPESGLVPLRAGEEITWQLGE